jgi:hypothetical protein
MVRKLSFPIRKGKIKFMLYVCKVKKKVKFTLVQALSFCTGCTPHRGSRDIALAFLDHGTRRGLGVSVMLRPLFTPGKDSVPIVQEAEELPRRKYTTFITRRNLEIKHIIFLAYHKNFIMT